MADNTERSDTLVIEFGGSTSVNYLRAVEWARRCSRYSEAGEGKLKRHRVMWMAQDLDALIPLYHLVRTWKSTQLSLNGRPAWGNVLGAWFSCFEQREQAPDPAGYCYLSPWDARELHPFGCQRAGQLRLTPDADWLRFGSLESDGAWVFDKARMRHSVLHQLHGYRFCPGWNRRWIDAFVDVFPDQVNPRRERDWVYQTNARRTSLVVSLEMEAATEGEEWPTPDRIIGVGPRDAETSAGILEGLFTLVQLKHGLAIPSSLHG